MLGINGGGLFFVLTSEIQKWSMLISFCSSVLLVYLALICSRVRNDRERDGRPKYLRSVERKGIRGSRLVRTVTGEKLLGAPPTSFPAARVCSCVLSGD